MKIVDDTFGEDRGGTYSAIQTGADQSRMASGQFKRRVALCLALATLALATIPLLIALWFIVGVELLAAL